MKTIRTLLAVLAAVFVPQLLPAQVQSLQSLVSQFNWSSVSATDSVVQVIAEEQGLQSVSPDQWPRSGTFWYVVASANGGSAFPLPMPPQDPDTPVYLITGQTYLVDATAGQIITAQVGSKTPLSRSAAVAAQVNVVSNLINQVQEAEFNRQLAELFGEDEAQNPNDFVTPTNDLTGLALQLTNVSNGFAYLNLLHATNWVYAVWSTTNLLSPWQLETELWPESTNSEPFTLATQGRQNLFLRAEDWTDVDSDGDGIPDWWVWFWYGDLSENATNLDALGQTLLYDYTNGFDPNVIQFTVQATNNYVNTMNAPLQLNLTAGKPYYVGVLVDDTNFNDASWDYYTGTNISVNLGLTQGWHDVWIGLAGFADDATEAVWQWRRLKLDYTAPLLVVTNPVSNAVSLPLTQIQGYSPEALGSLTYDLSNAVTTASNQFVEISGEEYSTNTFEFTTNYFQAYDLPLTNGLNLVTFHATDLAGNTASYTCALNYSPKTNAPAVQLLWPQTGMEICGSDIVCRGVVDDPSASVSVQLVDANGNTNSVDSLVGRDGIFYAGNLTLADGTNFLTYTVTDSSGQTTTTNISISTSDLGLTLDPVTAGQSQVTGTIDDDNYTVYVNGVTATNNGDGTWSATIPPVGAGGGAVVVNAVLNGGDPTVQQIVEPAQGVFISQYHSQYQRVEQSLWEPSVLDTEDGTVRWADGAGGTAVTNLQFSGADDQGWDLNFFWPASQWPAALPDGVETVSIRRADSLTNACGGPPLNQEHCDSQMPPTPSDETMDWSRRTADTEMKLATGGPNGSKQMNLWCITAGVTAYTNDAAGDAVGFTVPSEQITIGDLGNLDANGELWVTLPDNDPVVITAKDAGGNNYTFGESATKYHSTFEVFVRMPDPSGTANHSGFDYGHAWWCLSSDAPANVIVQQLKAAGLNTNAINQLNQEEGYGHCGTLSIKHLKPFDLEDTNGCVYQSNDDNTNRTYNIDFNELLKGLDWAQNLKDHPGTYSTRDNNCAQAVEKLGGVVGLPLPQTEYPEYLGNHLPPNN